jgi:hypothetical protein
MTCANCGYEVKPGDLFCGNCGAGQTVKEVSADQDPPTLAVPGFGRPSGLSAGPSALSAGPSALSAGPSPQAAAAGTQVRGDPPATAAVGTASPGSASPGAASPAHDPLGQNVAQEAYFASTRSAMHTVPAGAQETTELKYLRHTRNATVFIAVIVGIFTALAVIGVIWTAVNVARLNSEVNGVSNGINSSFNSNCESQGGTNPDC